MLQKPQTSGVCRIVLDRLWDQCNWTHEIWTLRHALIDGNRRKRTLERGPHIDFLAATGNALQEYLLLQIAKLHDRAVVSGRVCLTLEYVVEYGGWDPATLRKLTSLRKRLDSFQEQIRSARNRLISHNDLAAILEGQPLGMFKAGAERKYFKTLHSFVSSAYQASVGGPCASFSSLESEGTCAIAALATIATAGKRGRQIANKRRLTRHAPVGAPASPAPLVMPTVGPTTREMVGWHV
jgi:AbiU2